MSADRPTPAPGAPGASGGTQNRSTWGPTGLYSSVLVALVGLLAALALNANPPSPPSIAEFAPQAQKQIKKAPLQQTSDIGSGKGGNGVGGGPKPTPTPTASLPAQQRQQVKIYDQKQVHHCPGGPPRQILDTQSPPCIAYWDGDNGGALDPAHGITATEVRVGLASFGGDNEARVISDLQAFFNRNFEFYHRTVKFVPLPAAPSGGSDACTKMQAWADEVATLHLFASTAPGGDGEECFPTELARKHVVTILGQGAAGWYTQAQMRSFAPYLWEYAMSYEQYLDNMGRFFCAQMAHKTAAYSTQTDLNNQQRKFGLIFWPQPGPYPFTGTALKNALQRCGTPLREYDIHVLGSDNQAQLDAQSAVLAMKGSSAQSATCGDCMTTVVCLCEPLAEQYVAAAADANNYFPEWMLAWNNDFNVEPKLLWDNNNPQQRRALMGFAARPRQVPYPDATLNWALAAVDPGFQVNVDSVGYAKDQELYWNVLMVAAGIQMAGPHLSPANFQTGLQSKQFPNPWSPQEEGKVGFAGGSHSMTVDASVMWWSDAASSVYPDEGAGSWCYQGGGTRYAGSSWSRATLPPALPGGGFGGTCNPAPTPGDRLRE